MRFCPYAHRVHLVLDAKKIPYHAIYINLRDKPEWFSLVSSSTKVPALELVKEQGNPVLIESLIICDYLDEKYPEVPLYPKDLLKKAQEKILIERFGQFINAFYYLLLHDNPEQLVDTDHYAGLVVYEEELKRRCTKFFGGDSPGMLDYMMWPWCERFDSLKYTFEQKFELSPERFPTLVGPIGFLIMSFKLPRLFYCRLSGATWWSRIVLSSVSIWMDRPMPNTWTPGDRARPIIICYSKIWRLYI